MTLLRNALSAALLACTALLVGCSNGVFGNPEYLAVTISPRPASVAAGARVTLTASVTNNLSLPSWSLVNAGNTSSAGTLASVPGQPNSILYTAPAAAPIYSGGAAGFTQGAVVIQASVMPPAGSSGLSTATDSVSVFITTPSVSVTLAPSTVRVPLGQSFTFTGYAVGSENNAVTWQVNGVTGGSVSYGTITAQGSYTAPATMPMSGDTVTVTLISQADPSKAASAVLTLF